MTPERTSAAIVSASVNRPTLTIGLVVASRTRPVSSSSWPWGK